MPDRFPSAGNHLRRERGVANRGHFVGRETDRPYQVFGDAQGRGDERIRVRVDPPNEPRWLTGPNDTRLAKHDSRSDSGELAGNYGKHARTGQRSHDNVGACTPQVPDQWPHSITKVATIKTHHP